jgi:hypothetical protein
MEKAFEKRLANFSEFIMYKLDSILNLFIASMCAYEKFLHFGAARSSLIIGKSVGKKNEAKNERWRMKNICSRNIRKKNSLLFV